MSAWTTAGAASRASTPNGAATPRARVPSGGAVSAAAGAAGVSDGVGWMCGSSIASGIGAMVGAGQPARYAEGHSSPGRGLLDGLAGGSRACYKQRMSALPTAHWRPARCPLCDGSLLVRDDAEQVVCGACGSLLDVLPSATVTSVRHAGPGALLVLFGGYTLLGSLGIRRGPGWSSFRDDDQRALERQAQRRAEALAAEIKHRQRMLAQLRVERVSLGRR